MRLSIFSTLVLVALMLPSESPCPAADEPELIAILRSNAGPVAKAEACRQLRLLGTPNAVPALAAQLDDERVGHAARHALEALPFPEATDALRSALNRLSGPLRLGLIDSLGWRRDPESVTPLAPLLLASETPVGTAAATALGRIGTPAAIRALQEARDLAPPSVRPAVLDGLLAAADRRLSEGSISEAAALFQALQAVTEDETIRTAALVGWFRTAGDPALPRILAALGGDDPVAQSAALRVAAEVEDPVATASFAALLDQAPAARQVALLGLLQRRADPSALPAVSAAATNNDPAIRVAALRALGAVGDASSVRVLAEAAGTRTGDEQAAARQSLLLIHRGDVTAALIAAIPDASAGIRRELFRAVSARADRGAVPALLSLARGAPPPIRDGALQTLGTLADGRHLESLIRLVSEAGDEASRDDLRGVFESMIERGAFSAQTDLEPLLAGLGTGSAESRIALLPVAALIADARLRPAIRASLTDSDERVRSAASRAVVRTRDPGLMSDLLVLARQSPEPGIRSMALEGYVRLATDESHDLPVPQRVDSLRLALETVRRPEDARLVLSGLARLPDRRALELAERAGTDPAVKREADSACLQIARRLGGSEFEIVTVALGRLTRTAVDASIRTEAQALLRQLDSRWLAAGPYRLDGRQAQDLFDIPFAPERGESDVVWKRAPGSADPARAGEVDLSGITAGDHCVVYARTRVYSPSARPVTLSLGSDDGIKFWLNGEPIHANNAVRGLTPGQDRARGRLRDGWNDLLAKITQHTAGCGLSLRILADDGSDVSDLRFDPRGSGDP